MGKGMGMEPQDFQGMDLIPGQLYGERYRIVMPIGKGGMGRVYLAEDTRLGGKARALKLTRPLPEERRSFLPEAQLLSELDHPHLPAIVDYFPPGGDGIACIVMDYVAGDTLADRFERFGLKLAFRFVLDVLIDLTEVLTYLHAQRPAIVFRDLKPANVLIDRYGKAILVDFGIARRYRENVASDTMRLGTPGFAAPEQLRGEQSDERTDLYGLGALAYFLLSGGRFAIRHRGAFGEALQDDAPADFALLLGRLLSAEPSDRPSSSSELLEELLRIKLELVADSDYGNGRSSAEPTKAGDEARVVAVASAYPGAGATFAALALSSVWDAEGIAHALVECPGGEPELYALLNGTKRMPKGAVYARADGKQAASPAWRSGTAAYYPLAPDDGPVVSRVPDKDFAKWLRRLGVPLVLLDLSSRWDHPALMDWMLRTCDEIALVADCFPAKWSSRRQDSCMELQRQAERREIRQRWIANRDQSFPDRKAWLALLPDAPAACLPELPSSAVLRAMWRGEGFPRDGQSFRAASGALRPYALDLAARARRK